MPGRSDDRRVDGLLTEADPVSFPSKDHEFWAVELSLTLLPDEGCRFSSADFLVELSPLDENFPIVRRLVPAREASRKTVRVERKRGASASVNDHVVQVLEVGASASRSHSEEWEGSSVHLESFGAGTLEGGWRFTIIDGTESPLNTTGLRPLCVLPRGESTTATLKVVAGIDVRSAVDRWVTAAFRRKPDNIETSLDIG